MQVQLTAVTYRYRDGSASEAEAIKDLDLVIESRSVHAIVGPTGCGKSTLLRVLAGLAEPQSGSIDFRGRQMRPNRTALVFQDPTLIPWWSVGRNIGIGVEFSAKRRSLYRKIRSFSADRVGLKGMLDRMPGSLSAGQQTRAGMSRAFAHDADVMLLDEPFVHLDALTRRRLREEFETAWQIEPRTYVFVTHDVEEAVLLSDRVTVLAGPPAWVLETVEVPMARPRPRRDTTDPACRSAIAAVWDALERSSLG
ncbi:MAG: ABC transporter ATP-binding protein [Acidimicrobiaceae bacterium]|nr:ABC transporter ATP-binding protein [Acidimicrobiaceae bacterium]